MFSVCLFTRGGGTPGLWSQILSREGIPWSVIQGPFWGGGGEVPLVLSLVLSKVMSQVLLGGGGVPQVKTGATPPSRTGLPLKQYRGTPCPR